MRFAIATRMFAKFLGDGVPPGNSNQNIENLTPSFGTPHATEMFRDQKNATAEIRGLFYEGRRADSHSLDSR